MNWKWRIAFGFMVFVTLSAIVYAFVQTTMANEAERNALMQKELADEQRKISEASKEEAYMQRKVSETCAAELMTCREKRK